MNILVNIFKLIINMSSMASVVILLVLLLRFLLKKAPKKLTYGLWLIVAIRLIIPVMLPSSISVFNIFDIPSQNSSVVYYKENQSISNNNLNIKTDIDIKSNSNIVANVNNTVSDRNLGKHMIDSTFTISSLGYLFKIPIWSAYIWLAGMGVFLLYFTVSYVILSKKLKYATLVINTDTNCKSYYCENIKAPFVFGIIKPKIYLPYGISGNNLKLVLNHEQYHIQQKDYLTKLFAYILLSVYWFNPFIWIAYYYYGKDIELRCDEAVLKNANLETRKLYSNVLLAFAANNRNYLLSPVSLVKNNTKERIKIIMKGKKKSQLLTVISVILIIFVAIICLTDVYNKDKNDSDSEQIAKNFDLSQYYNKTYCTYEMNDLGIYIPTYIFAIDENAITLGYSETGEMSETEVYPYTISDDIVYYQNEKFSFKVDFANQTQYAYLTSEPDSFFAKHPIYIDEYTGFDPIFYKDFLSEEDISSAMSVAKKHYSKKDIEIVDISLSTEFHDLYAQIEGLRKTDVLNTYAVYPARNAIFFNVKVSDTLTRYISLTRSNIYSDWSIYNEGVYMHPYKY